MDEQTVLYAYNGMLFGNEKKLSTDSNYNIGEPNCVKSKKPNTKGPHMVWLNGY